ncbi:hypothetical protein WN943_004891 [Citrus x changshan-huyou]
MWENGAERVRESEAARCFRRETERVVTGRKEGDASEISAGISGMRVRGVACTQICYGLSRQALSCKFHILGIYDGTECLIRNVMALEQCHCPQETLPELYVNGVGDTAKIANLFNHLCQHIGSGSASCYYDVVMNLQAHYNNPWNHAEATLKRVYFTNLWTGTGTVAAVVLLVPTLIRTIRSIMSV